MHWLTMGQWSPYIVGIGIGILSWVSFVISDKAIGCSAAYSKTSGMLDKLLRGSKASQRPYYQQFPSVVDWHWMLVVGIVIGAFISAKLSGQFAMEWVPAYWAETFGDSAIGRWLVALLGGVFLGLGARWAGGCTSGHGISGTLQLGVSSWLAVMGFFAGGIVTAMFIFKVLI
jgi:uncharacterized membrane protein YedE/YeeE